MDKWFVNMVAGAVLSALLVLFGAGVLVDEIYPTGGEPEAPPAHSETADAQGGDPGAQEAAPQVSLASLLGAATVEAGESQAKKCVACHTFEEGGANKIGPNLHGIVGRPVASHEGFAYSTALQEYGGDWDYEKLSCFIQDPKGCVPGNKMSFAGVKKDSDRANVIAYLRSISPNAPPLPEDKSAEAAPAEGEQQQAAEPAATGQEEAAAANEQPQEAAAPADSQPQATESTEQPAAETAEQPAAAEQAQTEEPAAQADNGPAAAEASTTGGSSQN